MENWIGVGIWIVLGVLIGLLTKVVVKVPDEAPGHAVVLSVLGAFAAVIGGMLGVGIASFDDPTDGGPARPLHEGREPHLRGGRWGSDGAHRRGAGDRSRARSGGSSTNETRMGNRRSSSRRGI